MAQINPIVGDVSGNAAKVISAAQQARDEFGADLVVFPELVLTGYPPEDLLFKPRFIKQVQAALKEIKQQTRGIALLVGYPAGSVSDCLYNAASLIVDGKCLATYYKQSLPNYSVFDEKRYFAEGSKTCVASYKGIRFGITICEDVWFKDPVMHAAEMGADIVLNLNASPFNLSKWQQRETEVRQRVIETGLPIIYVNMVGGQDELVFDGCSFALANNGQKVAQAPAWQSGLYPVFIGRDDNKKLTLRGECSAQESEIAMIYNALVVGLRDYVEKNQFTSAVIGLSGGIDSSLTLALAVDALGADRVSTVMMPSRYTRKMSIDDAKEMANNCAVSHAVIPIDSVVDEFLASLSGEFAGKPFDVTEENIQARCRGVLLMAISNKTGAIVLATSNKSEMAVGYTTLYGDMAGGFAPLKDVYKTLVYQLAHYRNSLSNIIPERIITRKPSAELAPDQYDEDNLPPYDELDRLIDEYISEDSDIEDMLATSDRAHSVFGVTTMIDRNEYKRRQAPPGVRITRRAFGRDRRYPITSGYHGTDKRRENEKN